MAQTPAGPDLPCESRALVPLAAAPGSEPIHRTTPRHALFLAHLIATARQVPQARERRRAEPEEAIAAYAATLARLREP